MSNIGILFSIFGVLVILTGLYMFTGHKLEIIAWKAAFKGCTKEDWIKIGKYTMLVGAGILLFAFIAFLLNF